MTIRTFRDDGWLHGGGDAALVRVPGGPAQVLVTIYQSPNADASTAPNLQVVRLLEAGRPPGRGRARRRAAAARAGGGRAGACAGRGDVGARLGDWIGERGSKRWIEGFAIAPASGIPGDDIEYQAVLGRGWLSPWVEGGQFCGSRGMALPILGLRVRLRGASADTHDCAYSASFVDGTSVGPVQGGEACEAESLAPVEAFSVTIRPRAAGGRRRRPMPAGRGAGARTAAPAARPARRRPEAPTDRRSRQLPLPPARNAADGRTGAGGAGRAAAPACIHCRDRACATCSSTRTFPGQYLHFVRHLLEDQANEIVFLSEPNSNNMPGVRRVIYQKPARARRCTRTSATSTPPCAAPRRRPGWRATCAASASRPTSSSAITAGARLLDLVDVWPGTPLLGYFEFYYQTDGPGCRLRPGIPDGCRRSFRASGR